MLREVLGLMANRVVVSTNEKREYAWLAPLTALAWKHCAGFVPTIFVVGDVDPLILSKAVEAGADLIPVEPIPGYSTTAVAQMIRLYACAEPVCRGDYLMTTDVDAWPLSPAPFQPSGKDLDVYAALWPVFPIGYIGARQETWRAFMGIDAKSAGDALWTDLAHEPMLRDGFNIDEAHVTRRICNWVQPHLWEDMGGHPKATGAVQTILCAQDRARIVWRGPGDVPRDRIWFGHYPNPLPPGLTDAHLCSRFQKEAFSWPQLRSLLEYANLPPVAMAWADNYVREVPRD